MSEPRKYAIAVSFAGEDRGFVKELVGLLSASLPDKAVFYDENSQRQLAGQDFDLELVRIYEEKSDFLIPVFSKHYHDKPWCQDEWGGIRNVMGERRNERIVVPVALDDTRIPGWKKNDLALRRTDWPSVEKLAKVILWIYGRRLGVSARFRPDFKWASLEDVAPPSELEKIQADIKAFQQETLETGAERLARRADRALRRVLDSDLADELVEILALDGSSEGDERVDELRERFRNFPGWSGISNYVIDLAACRHELDEDHRDLPQIVELESIHLSQSLPQHVMAQLIEQFHNEGVMVVDLFASDLGPNLLLSGLAGVPVDVGDKRKMPTRNRQLKWPALGKNAVSDSALTLSMVTAFYAHLFPGQGADQDTMVSKIRNWLKGQSRYILSRYAKVRSVSDLRTPLFFCVFKRPSTCSDELCRRRREIFTELQRLIPELGIFEIDSNAAHAALEQEIIELYRGWTENLSNLK